ncbi:MAG: FecR domain-containing protein [Alphaproteobacteria bacterium]|nr:FecR domain-containing protein [Alphaproteobacteria bacterium]
MAWSEIARVKKVSGEAHIERSGNRLEARPGVTLEQGDVLVTGGNGRLSVTFIDNSRFSAGPNSRVSLERFEFDATTHEGAFETRVERGSLAVVSGQIAKQTPDAMKLRTPISILGVRGTRFILEVSQ